MRMWGLDCGLVWPLSGPPPISCHVAEGPFMLGGAVPQGAGRGCAGGEGGWLLVSPIGGLGSWRFWFGHGVL